PPPRPPTGCWRRGRRSSRRPPWCCGRARARRPTGRSPSPRCARPPACGSRATTRRGSPRPASAPASRRGCTRCGPGAGWTRGGVAGGAAAAAALAGVVLTGADAKAERGLDLLGGAVLDPRSRKGDGGRLRGVLEKYPGFVGFGVDEGAALVVRGRSLRVLG